MSRALLSLSLFLSLTALNAAPLAHADPEERTFVWPERLGDGNGLIIEDSRPITGWRGARVPNGKRLTPYPVETEQLEQFEAWVGEDLTPRFEPGGGFVIIPMLSENAEPDGKDHFAFYSAQAGAEAGEAELQRTWFTYDEPEDAEPIGLAILMPGIFATPRDVSDRAEQGLLNRNWSVLRMLGPPSRMSEHREYMYVMHNPVPGISKIAEDLDNRAAEAAFAVHAAARHAISVRPALSELPRVIIGMSGTAIALPTIVAYEPDAYDAAVLIGGGANSFLIARDSSYREWIDGVLINWAFVQTTEPASPESDTPARELYLQHSTLDGVHTAQSMREIPTLMIHGSRDTAVPASSGDLLWERLGKPERWEMPVGHELLFAAIPLRMVGILDWLEEQVLSGEGE